MGGPKVLNIAIIIMIMTLLSLATTAPAPAPAPTPYPVCTSHHTAAIILGQDQNAMKAFTYVIIVTNAKKLQKGMYKSFVACTTN